MFKCKECGQEYEIKPDYCECGNDEFETILPKQAVEIANPEPIRVEEKREQCISETIKTYSTSEAVSCKKSMSPGDILSIGFLILCIILSAIILLIPVKVNETDTNEKDIMAPTVSKNIPPIDRFWNNTVAVPAKSEDTTSKPAVISNEIKIPAPIQKVAKAAKTPTKVQAVQPTKTTSNSTVKKQPVKPTVQNKQQTPSAKPAQNTSTQKPKTSVSNQASPSVQKPVSQTQVAQTTQATVTQTQVPPSSSGTTTVTLNKNPNILKQELSNYKAALRNTIGRKIDFTKVVGDGSCSVAFKIDNSGRLINRSFSKQSSNMTLNDAVYAAVMATPSYEAPPAGYKGENLTLNIRFFNGNFEISLY